MNQKLKRLIRQLGEAIHESVSESDEIAGVVRNIREEGFDVLLMLEATIGLNELQEDTVEEAASTTPAGTFSAQDVSFLKSLRIGLEDDGAEVQKTDVQKSVRQKPLALPPGDPTPPPAA